MTCLDRGVRGQPMAIELPRPVRLGELPQTCRGNRRIPRQLYAVPVYSDAGLLFYRKDLLDKVGLTAPKTWMS
ncbi:extracellular solute-binding protein [Kibdelosporangium philippinense]|uniref:extracellular solute-binding protein n=1 Tax=Kibdelosporangium philippinense TaxID=211113 RepID=UPI0036157B20